MIPFLLALVLLTVPSAVSAQAPHAPYAGLERRSVKALSDRELADLKAGRGMGLALAAELNGYPGPMHVLEHAEALHLSPEQQARTQALFEAMKRDAVPLGERLIQAETRLDGLFSTRAITPASLSEAMEEIGRTQASLREAHLKYHLAMMEVLSPHQLSRYRELRGYAARGEAPARHQGGGSSRP